MKLEASFEQPSIVHIRSKDGLRRYNTPPVFDKKYLVIFENKKILDSNMPFIQMDFMFPVITCASRGQSDDIRYLCAEKKELCRTFVNAFKRSDALDLIRDLATEKVSDSFCEALVARVGLSPQRIISAMMVCEQVGYSTSNITKYVDKYNYIDIYDVIESLLGICRFGSQRKRAALYIHQNRLWYNKFTKQSLLREIDLLLKLYQDITNGSLTEYTLGVYIEREHIPRYRAIYAVDLYERVPFVTLMSLKQFLEKASLMEVVLRLS